MTTESAALRFIDDANQSWHEEKPRLRLAVRDADTGRLTGYLDLWRYTDRGTRIEIIVRPRSRKLGFGLAAVMMGTAAIFEYLGSAFAEAEIEADNVWSRRIAKQAGYREIQAKYTRQLDPIFQYRAFPYAWTPLRRICWESPHLPPRALRDRDVKSP